MEQIDGLMNLTGRVGVCAGLAPDPLGKVSPRAAGRIQRRLDGMSDAFEQVRLLRKTSITVITQAESSLNQRVQRAVFELS